MTKKRQLEKRFEATKISNFNESLRLEGLKPNQNKSDLNRKVLAEVKRVTRAK